MQSHNIEVFFALVRAGLWEKEVRLLQLEKVDYNDIYRLSEEQSVIGLVAAGLEHILDIKAPQDMLLQFVGQALQMEHRNIAMNHFIGVMLKKMMGVGIDAVLIKGQGLAQCYERPLWRSAGDVDLLLEEDCYEKGKTFIAGLTDIEPEEYKCNKEFVASIQGWCLELHGSLRCGLSVALNREIDAIHQDICNNHHVRYWETDGMRIPLPEENDDVLLIFTHFIKHFYKGGLGIRQICDWCRLLWTYQKTIDVSLLEQRLKTMKLIPEWKAFAAYAVDYLGMPVVAMPLYDGADKWKRKASKIQVFIVKVGNLGHNMDRSYYSMYPFLIRKTISMWRRIAALFNHIGIFPQQTLRYFPYVIYSGLRSAIRGD